MSKPSSSAADDQKKLLIAAGVTAGVALVGYLFWKYVLSSKKEEKEEKAPAAAAAPASPAAAAAAAPVSDQKDREQAKKNAEVALASIDFGRASKLSKEQISSLWDKYDADKSGYLDQSEIRNLVKEVLRQIYQEKSVLTKYMAHMFDESTEHTQKHAIHGRLRVLHKELHDKSEGVAYELFNRLDLNQDGKISKEEFTVAFALWLEKKQEQEIRDYLL